MSAYILPLSACTHPLGHSALTHLSHTAHSLPLVCAFPLLNSALTHVQFALNLPHTTLNTHPLSAHIPSALTQLTDTAHSQLTHRALTQRTHDLRCRVIRDERQLALGVHCLTTVCTHPLCTHLLLSKKIRSIRSFSFDIRFVPSIKSIRLLYVSFLHTTVLTQAKQTCPNRRRLPKGGTNRRSLISIRVTLPLPELELSVAFSAS